MASGPESREAPGRDFERAVQARRPRSLLAILAGAAAIAAAGAVVGSRFSTPAQQAADAKAPSPSLVTMPVQRGRLAVTVAFRAELADSNSVSIPAPTGLDGSLPIVTALGVRVGSDLKPGEVLASVAGRPVIVLPGRIPAYRTITLGDAGVDVAQLQTALGHAGYLLGSDSFGTYGLGTAAAVKALYTNLGYPPIMTPLAPPAPSRKGKHVTHRPSEAATVPLGEVAFLPVLPARVTKLDVGLGRRATGTMAAVGSGRLLLSGTIAQADAPGLAVGQMGTATSDLTGQRIRVRIVRVHPPQVSAATRSGEPPTEGVVLAPAGRVPPALIGQNLKVSIHTAGTRGSSWLVPVAAVITAADGRSSVIVEDSRGRQREVPIAPGPATGGREAVSTLGTPLALGEPVVIGTGTGS